MSSNVLWLYYSVKTSHWKLNTQDKFLASAEGCNGGDLCARFCGFSVKKKYLLKKISDAKKFCQNIFLAEKKCQAKTKLWQLACGSWHVEYGVSCNLNVEYEFSTYDFQLYWDFKIPIFFPDYFRTLFNYALFAMKICTKDGLINTTKITKL